MTTKSSEFMSANEAAKELNIHLLAIGKLMFEGLLRPAPVGEFYRKDVIALKSQTKILERLR